MMGDDELGPCTICGVLTAQMHQIHAVHTLDEAGGEGLIGQAWAYFCRSHHPAQTSKLRAMVELNQHSLEAERRDLGVSGQDIVDWAARELFPRVQPA